MKNSLLTVAALFILAGCGDNIQGPPPSTGFSPPAGLEALSLNDSTILVLWSPSPAESDTSFALYVVSWNGLQRELPKTTHEVTIDSLAPGAVDIAIRGRRTNGEMSDPATIRWAPAARFDSATVIPEYYHLEQSRLAGMDVGGESSDPLTMQVSTADPAATQMDFYLFGGEGEIQQPLALRSANLFFGAWNITLFSTVSHPSNSLDLPLVTFPGAQSFTLTSVDITDNTIYYAQVVGDQGGINFVRIHVHILPGGGSRNRSVELRLSVQRIPSVMFAINSINTKYQRRVS